MFWASRKQPGFHASCRRSEMFVILHSNECQFLFWSERPTLNPSLKEGTWWKSELLYICWQGKGRAFRLSLTPCLRRLRDACLLCAWAYVTPFHAWLASKRWLARTKKPAYYSSTRTLLARALFMLRPALFY